MTILDDCEQLLNEAARQVAQRYTRWGVDYDEARQELIVWLLERAHRARRLLDEGQEGRLYGLMAAFGGSYGEREKAARVGYDPDDTYWYTPSMVQALLPLALDETYDGSGFATDEPSTSGGSPIHEGGDMLAKVMDVRVAIDRLDLDPVLRFSNPEAPDHRDAVMSVVDYLGGAGRRKHRSNASAQVLAMEAS